LRSFASAQIILPSIVLTESEMAVFARSLRAFRPEVLYGYPVALTQFAEYVASAGGAIEGIRSIITTAERLTEVQRRKLQQIFGGEVFNLYCTREYGCVGFECSRHDGMHVDTGSVCVEILRDDASVPPGEVGEIVVTDLLNRGMPFIRSSTGDQGSFATEACPCGSPFPLLRSLDGRTTDTVLRPDGSRVMGLMLADLFTDHPTIRFVQFMQHADGALEVRVVATEPLGDAARSDAEREVRTMVGDVMPVSIVQVPDIARNPRSGKFQEVISHMSPAGGSSV
jgi:phenylacetate-CoA ligase